MTSISGVDIYTPSVPQPAHVYALAPQPAAAPAATPTQAVIAEANRVAYVTDVLGRRLGIVRITASIRRRVLKALSPASGEKSELLIMSLAAASCVEIDGLRVPFPQTEVALDALIDRLEQEGLSAVVSGWAEHFPIAEVELKN